MNLIYFLAPASKIRESCSFSVVFPTQIESFRVCLLDETNPFEGLKGTWGVVMIIRINKQSFFFHSGHFGKSRKSTRWLSRGDTNSTSALKLRQQRTSAVSLFMYFLCVSSYCETPNCLLWNCKNNWLINLPHTDARPPHHQTPNLPESYRCLWPPDTRR